jgi:hypothetical protein
MKNSHPYERSRVETIERRIKPSYALGVLNAIESNVQPCPGHQDSRSIADCFAEVRDFIRQTEAAATEPTEVEKANRATRTCV